MGKAIEKRDVEDDIRNMSLSSHARACRDSGRRITMAATAPLCARFDSHERRAAGVMYSHSYINP
jgi:hypothetical protein